MEGQGAAVNLKEAYVKAVEDATREAVKKMSLKMEADLFVAMTTGFAPRERKATLVQPAQLEPPTIDGEYTILDEPTP